MGLKNLQAKRAGGSSNSATENILVVVNSYDLANAQTATPESDMVAGTLFAPAFGLDTGTAVKVRLRPDPQADTRKQKRREIFGLTRKFGTAQPVQVGGIVEFDRCYIEKDGVINSGWMKPIKTDPKSALEHVFPSAMVMVDVERKRKESDATYQTMTLFNAPGAKVVKNVDEMRAAIIEAIGNATGSAGFVLRGIDLADGTCVAARWTRRSVKDEAGNYVPEDVQATIKAFEESANGKEFVNYMGSYDQAVWEVIPTLAFPIGNKSLPSQSDRGIDLSKPYMLEVAGDGDKKRKIAGVSVSHAAIMRMDDQSDYWFVAGVKPSVNGGGFRVYDYANLPTPNMPAEVLAKVEAAAKDRVVSFGEEAQEDAAPGEDQSFGEQEAAPGLNA